MTSVSTCLGKRKLYEESVYFADLPGPFFEGLSKTLPLIDFANLLRLSRTVHRKVLPWYRLCLLNTFPVLKNNLYIRSVAKVIHFSNRYGLIAFNLSQIEITDSDFALLCNNPNIVKLATHSSKLGYPGIQHSTRLEVLTFLNLACCSLLSDRCMEVIGNLTQLRELNLFCCEKLTDASLTSISPLTNLQSLTVAWNPNFTDEGIRGISGLGNLTYLNMSWIRLLSNQGLQILTALTGLEHLNLSWDSRFTDRGLEPLKLLTNLKTLNFSACNLLTGDFFQYLYKTTSLINLNLKDCTGLVRNKFKILSPLTHLKITV